MSTHVEKGDVLGSSQFRAHARRGENGHQQQKLQSQVLQLFVPCSGSRVCVLVCLCVYVGCRTDTGFKEIEKHDLAQASH